MPGMHNRSLDLTNAFVVSLFHHSLYVRSVLFLAGAALTTAALAALPLASRKAVAITPPR